MSPIILVVIAVLYLVWRLRNPPKEEPSLEDKHVLITGASSGIGRALAVEALHRSPARLTLVARDEKRLAETRETLLRIAANVGTDIKVLSMDITLPYDEILKTLKANNIGVVDILINCAGAAVARTFEDTPPKVFEDMIRVNYMGAVNMTKALLPDMIRPALAVDSKGEGCKIVYPNERRIAFFSSPAAQLPIYGFAAYSASKAALSTFANTIQQELEDDGIAVTVVYPPDTDTPGFTVENEGKPKLTKIISESGGLETATSVAGRSMHYVLIGRRNCAFGPLGRALLWYTAGISRPQDDTRCPFSPLLPPIVIAAIEVAVSPLLKIVSFAFAYWMRHCIKNLHKQ